MPSSDSFYSDTNITDLVNAALSYITTRHDWYWLEASETLTATANTETMPTAAGSQRTIALYDSTGIQLEWMSYSDLVRIPFSAKSDTLRFFGYRGSTLVVRPVPSTTAATLTHVYRGVEPVLLTGSDTPLMPVQFHDAIADWATYFAHMRQGNLNDAKAWQASGDTWIQSMVENADRYADSLGGGARTATPDQGAA